VPESSMHVDAITDPLAHPGLDPDDGPAEHPGGPDPQIERADPGLDPEVVVLGMRPAPSADEPVTVGEFEVELLARWGVDLPRRLARVRATGARSEVVWIDLERDDPRAVLMLGLGSASPAELRRSAAAAVRRLRGVGGVLVLATRELDQASVRAFTEGLYLATGTVTWASSPPPAPPERVRVTVADLAWGADAVAEGRAHAETTIAARQLIHTPSNIKSPEWLADRAAGVADAAGLGVRVRGVDDLARDGFGGILAVGVGSVRPPRLVEMAYPGDGAQARQRTRRGQRPGAAAGDGPGEPRHVVLVGKGITFDSGGLSLKRPDSMIGMKTDMSGAAVVCAVMGALPGRVPPGLRVTGVLCLAENLPGAAATRPDDVIVHHGGLTSEVGNTDAEGRLVLGDGLDYAVRDLAADVVVDVATLTGAATLGLGRRYAAMFSTSDGLARALVEAGEAAGEQLWRMPLHEDYAELITSEVADQSNSSSGTGPGPGAITAALFLRRFVGDTAWAHLDIAGVGRSDAERDDLPKGGTGFGARLLLRWLEAGAPA
jgi:leucyl aminopeptidase